MEVLRGKCPGQGYTVLVTRPTVLMIVGHGRSGSSIIERMLGGSEGFTNVGEAYFTFRGGVSLDLFCRCGQRFSSCSTWQEIGHRAFGGWNTDDAAWMYDYFQRHLRYRQLPALARRLAARRADDDRRYVDTFEALYRSMAALAQGDVIVDSSKHLGHAVAMARAESIDLRVLHLVRDPRGNAYSWQKKGVDLAPMGLADRSMPVFSPARTAADWLTRNLLTDRLLARAIPRVRVRYEDFAAAPITTLEQALSELGIHRAPTWQHVHEGVVSLPVDHALGGNPGVISAKTATVRTDDEWRTNLSLGDRMIVAAIAAPLMLAYRYPLRTRRPA